ncbi:MAG: glycerol kinase GlpK [Anaeroplasma bactoclasticum]|nr:glycerol kinase GlpK [Anaeroplasma bactoclasticum]
MKQYILTIDQGTTSTRAILFDEKVNIIAMNQIEFNPICPNSGWVEQNPEEIWELVYQVIQNVIRQSNIDVTLIKGIGITNQRETTVIWDRSTGKPVYNAIVWQSRQSQSICESLIQNNKESEFLAKTGLVLNPYFSASKIKWIFDHVEGVKKRADQGELLFGTIDTYLLWKLTKGSVHATDYSNASRTLLYNINTLKWDESLMKYFDVPMSMLPEVKPSSHIFGYATALSSIDQSFEKVPIASMIGDQQAALFGQCCFEAGSIKSTYGTGCFILMNTGTQRISSQKGLLTTIAWGLDGKIEYALEGSVFVAGSAIQWLRDGLEFFKMSSECEKSTRDNNPSQGVYMVPAFVGLGTPYWDNDVRGAIFGLTRSTTKNHIIAATIESIAYQAKDVMDVMQEESNYDIQYLGVDGGASVNDYMMQFQADLLNCKLIRPLCKETTALGATYLAGLSTGVFHSREEIQHLHQVEQVFVSRMDNNERKNRMKGWKTAIQSTLQYKINQ